MHSNKKDKVKAAPSKAGKAVSMAGKKKKKKKKANVMYAGY